MAHWMSSAHDAVKHIEAEISGSGEATFGVFDGLTTVVGVIGGLLSQSPHTIIMGCVGLAVASMVGMGAGQFLGDPRRRIDKAIVMGLAALIGVLLPAVPFMLFRGHTALLVGAGVAVLMTTGIAVQRSKGVGKVRGFLETFGIVAIATALTILATLISGIS